MNAAFGHMRAQFEQRLADATERQLEQLSAAMGVLQAGLFREEA